MQKDVYSLYSQIHSNTAVRFSTCCNFISEEFLSLIIVGINFVKIYKVIDDSNEPSLEFLLSFDVFGDISGLTHVCLGGKISTLIISFELAKVVLMKYDPEVDDVVTTSLHNFETNLLSCPRVNSMRLPSLLRTDQDNRCTAFLSQEPLLFVLPFMKSAGNFETNESSTEIPSFSIDLWATFDERIINVVDMQFLVGYNEPTLLIMYEPNVTWAGLINSIRDTFALVAISLANVDSCPIIWSHSGLPYDCQSLLPVPRPFGGVLVLAVNSIIYLNQGSPTCSLGLNCIVEESTAFPFEKNDLSLTIEGAVSCFISPSQALIGLPESKIYLLNFESDRFRIVQKLQLTPLNPSFVISTPFCMIPFLDFVFLGSVLGTSQLLKIKFSPTPSEMEVEKHQQVNTLNGSPAKLNNDIIRLEDIYDDIDVGFDPFFSGTCISMDLCEEIENIGPCLATDLAYSNGTSHKFSIKLVLSSGFQETGHVTCLERSVKPCVMTSFKLTQSLDLFTLRLADSVFHDLLLISRSNGTLVFSNGSEITEIDDGGFSTMETTVYATTIMDYYFIQICQQSAYLFTKNERLFSISLPRVCQDAVLLSDPCVIFHSSCGRLFILEVEETLSLRTYPLILGEDIPISTFTHYSDDQGFLSNCWNCSGQVHAWILLIRKETLEFEIWSWPQKELYFRNKNLHVFPQHLYDMNDPIILPIIPHSVFNSYREGVDQSFDTITEFVFLTMGQKYSKNLLFLVTKNELHIYAAFCFAEKRLRFKKLRHSVLIGGTLVGTRMLNPFTKIGGYSGLFVCGSNPYWFILSASGVVQQHRMSSDQQIISFACFTNPNSCSDGFIYLTDQNVMNIASLNYYDKSLESEWITSKSPQRATVHFICHNPSKDIYAVVCSEERDNNILVRMLEEDQEVLEVETESGFVLPRISWFFVKLLSVDMEEISNTRIDFELWEQVTCCRFVSLRNMSATEGRSNFLVTSMVMCSGEEVTSRGKIYLHEVIEVVPEPGVLNSKHRLKKFYEKEQRAPATALCECNGFLIAAIGQKIYALTIRKSDNDLTAIAFVDSNIYCTTMTCLKNLILAADIVKSVALLHFDGENRVLSLVSKHVDKLEVITVNYLVNNSGLSFIASCTDGNLNVFEYRPEVSWQSGSGQWLHLLTSFHVGSLVSSMWRISRQSGPNLPQITYFAMNDGGISCVVPLNEKIFKRLRILQSLLSVSVCHTAFLNPQSHRQGVDISRNRTEMLDKQLLDEFIYLNFHERLELARKIGSTVVEILEDLRFVQEATLCHF